MSTSGTANVHLTWGYVHRGETTLHSGVGHAPPDLFRALWCHQLCWCRPWCQSGLMRGPSGMHLGLTIDHMAHACIGKSCKVSAALSQRDPKVALTKIQLGEQCGATEFSHEFFLRGQGVTCPEWLLCWLLEDQRKGEFLPFSVWLLQGLKSSVRNLSWYLALQGGVIPLKLLA